MAIYFIDSIQGCNDNTGISPEQAFQNFEKINTMSFSAGDKILLKRGSVFTDHFALNGSGEEFSPIQVSSYGEDVRKPKILTQDDSPYAVLVTGEYVSLTGIEVSNPKGTYGILLDSHVVGATRGITISECYVHDVWTINDLGPRHVSGREWPHEYGGISVETLYTDEPTWYEDLRIVHNAIENVNRTGIWLGGRWSNRCKNSCSWMKNKADGMNDAWYPHKNIAISWNYVDHAHGDGIVALGTTNLMMEYNRVFYANCMSREGASNVGLWTLNCNGAIVQYNEVAYTGREFGGDGEGYDIDLCNINNIFQYNYSHHNEGGFMLVCNGCNDSDSMHNNIVRNNLSVDDATLKDAPVITISATMRDIYFVNNTIYTTHEHRYKWIQFCDYWKAGLPRDIYFVNNLFYAEHDNNWNNFEAAGNIVFDHNVFYHAHPLPDWDNIVQKDNFWVHPVLAQEDKIPHSRLAARGFTPEWNSPLLRLGKYIEQCSDRDYFGADTRGHQYIGAIYYEDLDK